MKILLDTNFILTCVKQKIDFLGNTNLVVNEKIEFILPEEVRLELLTLSSRKGESTKDKIAARTALKILENQNLPNILLENKDVDTGIVEYVSSREDYGIATLDRELKKRVSCPILTIRDKKSLEII